MSMKIILLSSDRYLYVALQSVFPDIIRSDSFIAFDTEIVVIIDDREPLSKRVSFYDKISNYQQRVSCLILNMRRKSLFIKREEKLSLSQLVLNLYKKFYDVQEPYEPAIEISIDEDLKKFLILTLEGNSFSKISTFFSLTEKGMYKHRTLICHQHGYNSFLHACIHIFENNLLTRDYQLPAGWVT